MKRFIPEPRAAKQELEHGPCTLLIGNPGLTGCTDVSGSAGSWPLFADPEYGILHAMEMLGLHVMILPVAR